MNVNGTSEVFHQNDWVGLTQLRMLNVCIKIVNLGPKTCWLNGCIGLTGAWHLPKGPHGTYRRAPLMDLGGLQGQLFRNRRDRLFSFQVTPNDGCFLLRCEFSTWIGHGNLSGKRVKLTYSTEIPLPTGARHYCDRLFKRKDSISGDLSRNNWMTDFTQATSSTARNERGTFGKMS